MSELECFLEVQGATAREAEEVACALAEELEAWAKDASSPARAAGAASLSEEETSGALELARELRLLGWLVSVDLGADFAKLMDRLEGLVARATDVLMPPVDNLAESGPRRKHTPPAGLSLVTLFGAEDEEQTVVKKAKWDTSRSTNHVLKRDLE
ncbi:MAG: hypothetical protein HOW73_08940 [Polyangiaceae bacterium]|nr:hypothetical protein [Polyangiaceae bacterium]